MRELYPWQREQADAHRPLFQIARDGATFMAAAVDGLHWKGEPKTFHAVKVSAPQIWKTISFGQAFCGREVSFPGWEQPTQREAVNCPKCLGRLSRLKEPSVA